MSSQEDSSPVTGPGAASAEDLAAALAVLPHPVFILKAVRDADGTVLELRYAFGNEASARLVGQPFGPLIGRGVSEVFPSVRELGIFDTYVAAIDSDQPVSFDVPSFRENGVEGSFSLTVIRFGDGLLVSAVDTTEQRKAERALADSSRKYRLLAENATDVVTLTDRDRRVTWVSPSVTRTLGWTPEELMGTRLSDLVHPDDRESTTSARDALYAGQEVTPPGSGFLMRIQSKSGDYRWISLTATPVTNESGTFEGVVGGWHYVDDLVQAQQAIQAEQASLRATLDSLLDPHVVLEPVRDEAGQIVDFTYVDANPAACAYNGMEYQDLVGSRLLDLLPGHAGAGLLDQYRHVVESGQPLALDDVVYSQELFGGVDRHYDVRVAPAGDGLSYTWRDVTDRNAFAQKLAESEEHYRLVAENVSDVAMALSSDHRFEWVSGSVAHVMGWQPSDLVGHLIDEFVHPDDLDQHGQVIADASSGSVMNVDFRFRRRDGTYRWVACRTRFTAGEDDAPIAVAGGLVDIQERKEAEAQELNRLAELERFQRLTVGRELKMIELKKEIEYLKKYGPGGVGDLATRPEAEGPEADQH